MKKKKKKQKSAKPENKHENRIINTKFTYADTKKIKRAAEKSGDYFMSTYIKRIVKKELGL